ncbi:MAG: hypothetical protein WCG06_05905 [Candidatus Omnitrophota bacterium]
MFFPSTLASKYTPELPAGPAACGVPRSSAVMRDGGRGAPLGTQACRRTGRVPMGLPAGRTRQKMMP